MRILNRVVAASALVVPMALGASGVAVAGVAAGSPALPTPATVSGDGHHDNCDGKDHDDDGDGFLSILNLGGGDDDHDDHGKHC